MIIIKEIVKFRPTMDTRDKMKILLKDFPQEYPSISLLCRAGIQALFREKLRLAREGETEKDIFIRERYSKIK